MGKIKEIQSEIERMVRDGEIKNDSLIRVPNLNERDLILLKGCYAGNRNYEMQEERIVKKDNVQDKKYDLYLKYVVRENA